MSRRNDAISNDFSVCRWINLEEALHHFATCAEPTQSQKHIKPLHWYVASRLVLEGGFDPDEITPHPPFRTVEKGGKCFLYFDPERATGGERTLLGGLKTKDVDVVVAKDGIGPVLAVSCKGIVGAFRNLTNRMEEAIGDCTNLHITYPALVFGYMFVIRANRRATELAEALPANEVEPARQLAANDFAIREGGEPVETIFRYYSALRELTGRRGIRDEVSGYEAISLAMIEPHGERAGELLTNFPPLDSALRIEKFFQTLYLRYEERYVFSAPDLKSTTRRLEWDPESPALQSCGLFANEGFPAIDYEPRLRE